MKVLKIAGGILAWLAISLVQLVMVIGILFAALALGSLLVKAFGGYPEFGRDKNLAIAAGLILCAVGYIALEWGLKKLAWNWLRPSQNPIIHLNLP